MLNGAVMKRPAPQRPVSIRISRYAAQTEERLHSRALSCSEEYLQDVSRSQMNVAMQFHETLVLLFTPNRFPTYEISCSNTNY